MLTSIVSPPPTSQSNHHLRPTLSHEEAVDAILNNFSLYSKYYNGSNCCTLLTQIDRILLSPSPTLKSSRAHRIINDVRYQNFGRHLTTKCVNDPEYLKLTEWCIVTKYFGTLHAFPKGWADKADLVSSKISDISPPMEIVMFVSGISKSSIVPLSTARNCSSRKVVKEVMGMEESHNIASYLRGMSRIINVVDGENGVGEIKDAFKRNVEDVMMKDEETLDYIHYSSTSFNLSSIIQSLCSLGIPTLPLMTRLLSCYNTVEYLNKELNSGELANVIVGVSENDGYVSNMEELLDKREDAMDVIVGQGKGRKVLDVVFSEDRTSNVLKLGDLQEVLKVVYNRTYLMAGPERGKNGRMKNGRWRWKKDVCPAMKTMKEIREDVELSQALERKIINFGSTSDIGRYCYCLTHLHEPAETFAKRLEDERDRLRILFVRHCELKAASQVLGYAARYGHKIDGMQGVLKHPNLIARIESGLKRKKTYRVVGGAKEGAEYVQALGKLGYVGGNWGASEDGVLGTVGEKVLLEGGVEDFTNFLWGVCMIDVGMGGMELLDEVWVRDMVVSLWDGLPPIPPNNEISETNLVKFDSIMIMARAAKLNLEMRKDVKERWDALQMAKMRNGYSNNKKVDNFSHWLGKQLHKHGIKKTWQRYRSPFLDSDVKNSHRELGGGYYNHFAIQFAFPDDGVAWVLDGRNFFMRETDVPNGLYKAKGRVLESQGWRVKRTSWLEFEYVRGNTILDKREMRQWLVKQMREAGVEPQYIDDSEKRPWSDDEY